MWEPFLSTFGCPEYPIGFANHITLGISMSTDEIFEKFGEVEVSKFIAEGKYDSAILPLAKVWLVGKDRERLLQIERRADRASRMAIWANIIAIIAMAIAAKSQILSFILSSP